LAAAVRKAGRKKNCLSVPKKDRSSRNKAGCFRREGEGRGGIVLKEKRIQGSTAERVAVWHWVDGFEIDDRKKQGGKIYFL